MSYAQISARGDRAADEEGKTVKHIINLDSYDTDYVEIPTRPDIDRMIVIPLKTVFINLSAGYGANVTQLVFDLDQPMGFTIYAPFIIK